MIEIHGVASRPEPEQDMIITRGWRAGFWRERRSGHGFRPLQTMCDMWADEFEAKAAPGEPVL